MKLPDDMHLTQAQAENIYSVVMSIKRAVANFIKSGNHKRIVHLAVHAKKLRTRKKNLRRAGRCILKEVDNA